MMLIGRAIKIVKKLFGPLEIEVDGERVPEDQHAEFFRQLRQDQEERSAQEVVTAINRLYSNGERSGSMLSHISVEIHRFFRNTGHSPSSYAVTREQMNELWEDPNFQRIAIIAPSTVAPHTGARIMGAELVVDTQNLGPRS